MPKINNFIIICCRKSYLNVCSNSHIPVVKLLNNSSKKNKAEMNITPVMPDDYNNDSFGEGSFDAGDDFGGGSFDAGGSF